ncbi:MAG: CsoR family transcriptional regulator [Dethiosulfovibrio peptidovorans]|nr:MAG: CsoR family transcriptional regulator [Dethiosulfovibrio peptidovorans]
MSLCGEDHKKIIDRISRIEGQIRAIKKLVEDDRDCMQVIKQVAAAQGALRSLGAVLLENHLKGCVTQAMADHQGHDALIDDVVDIFKKFGK